MKNIVLWCFCGCFCVFAIFLYSCSSTKNIDGSSGKSQEQTAVVSETEKKKSEPQIKVSEEESEISLVFAGDVMAHSSNYRFPDFKRIWKGISSIVKSGDLSFANIEAPVADSLPWSNYPNFNMHSSYVEAAIDAGFNVFSLANNHTNDQELKGIQETKKYFDNRIGIYHSGLRKDDKSPLSYALIEKNGWKVLFVAITEVLNRPIASDYINYVPSTMTKRTALKKELKELREENPCDVFVLSVHCDEDEYVHSIKESQKLFYKELVSDCNVDVIWANHPHIVREWEKIELNGKNAFIMYSNGNTISGQRYKPKFDNSTDEWEDTGDGLIIRLKFSKKTRITETKIDENSEIDKKVEFFPPEIKSSESFFITTFIAPSGQFLIKPLSDEYIEILDFAENLKWVKYLKSRKSVMEKIKTKIGE